MISLLYQISKSNHSAIVLLRLRLLASQLMYLSLEFQSPSFRQFLVCFSKTAGFFQRTLSWRWKHSLVSVTGTCHAPNLKDYFAGIIPGHLCFPFSLAPLVQISPSVNDCLSYLLYCNCSAVLHFIHIMVFILLRFNNCKEQVLFYLDMNFFRCVGEGEKWTFTERKTYKDLLTSGLKQDKNGKSAVLNGMEHQAQWDSDGTGKL